MTDAALEALFATITQALIVLLEDVDVAGLQRASTTPLQPPTKPRSKPQTDNGYSVVDEWMYQAGRSSLTLSGLLNIIDGPCSKDGRILLMTSNAPDSLDPALVRSGRCDRQALFGYAGREVCEKLFTHIYTKLPSEMV